MLDRIRKIISGMDAKRESDSERDGFLSYAAETHSMSLGVYDGMKTWRLRPKEMRDNPNVTREPWYYTGGYVIGTLLQLVIVLVVGFNVV